MESDTNSHPSEFVPVSCNYPLTKSLTIAQLDSISHNSISFKIFFQKFLYRNSASVRKLEKVYENKGIDAYSQPGASVLLS